MNGVNNLCYSLYLPYYIIPTGSFVGGAIGWYKTAYCAGWPVLTWRPRSALTHIRQTKQHATVETVTHEGKSSFLEKIIISVFPHLCITLRFSSDKCVVSVVFFSLLLQICVMITPNEDDQIRLASFLISLLPITTYYIKDVIVKLSFSEYSSFTPELPAFWYHNAITVLAALVWLHTRLRLIRIFPYNCVSSGFACWVGIIGGVEQKHPLLCPSWWSEEKCGLWPLLASMFWHTMWPYGLLSAAVTLAECLSGWLIKSNCPK